MHYAVHNTCYTFVFRITEFGLHVGCLYVMAGYSSSSGDY